MFVFECDWKYFLNICLGSGEYENKKTSLIPPGSYLRLQESVFNLIRGQMWSFLPNFRWNSVVCDGCTFAWCFQHVMNASIRQMIAKATKCDSNEIAKQTVTLDVRGHTKTAWQLSFIREVSTERYSFRK